MRSVLAPNRVAPMRRVAALLPRPASVLEVGSWCGESALLWARAIGEGSVMCVDPWRPYASARDVPGLIYHNMDAALASGEAYQEFLQTVQSFPAEVVGEHFRGTLREAVRCAALDSVYDLVYLDGSHYLADVREDLALARGMVRDGGILCGDDLEKQGDAVNLVVERMRTDVDYDHSHSYHPGVTVAVWEAFGPVWAENGFWAMRRCGTGWEATE